jgi:putative sporulation protein YyaC
VWKSIPKIVEPEHSPGFNARVHVDHPSAGPIFQTNLALFMAKLYDPLLPLIILCIGTDRSTGDSLGPLIGSKLDNAKLNDFKVYGTLDEPVHAVNLQENIERIQSSYSNPFILAIDACLGRTESVGYISIKEGSLQPGTGVNKNLPAVGNLQVIGIVNVGGFMEYMVLQNTRLSLVMKMANIISQGIINEIRKFSPMQASLVEASPITESLYLNSELLSNI